MTIDAKTQLYGLLAHPSQHSQSPLMHNLSFQYHHLNATYLAFDVDLAHLKGAIDGIRSLQIAGVNLSMPLKTAVLPYLDEIEPAAKLIGAVNTIKNDQGYLTGYNTDGLGLLRALPASFQPKGAEVILLGAGGAATSVAVRCAMAGVAKITIFNRHIGADSRAVALQNLIQTNFETEVAVFTLGDAGQIQKALQEADLLINGTNLGMGAHLNESPLPVSQVWPNLKLIVFDMIYVPRETKLLKSAKAAGLTQVYNGLGMLRQQGAAAFKIWTGLEMPMSLVEEKLELN